MGTFCKVKATLWKCLIVRKKHYFMTIFVIGLPILLFGLLGYMRSILSGSTFVDTPTYNPTLSEDNIYNTFGFSVDNLLFAPNTTFTRDVVREIQLKYNLLNNEISGFNSENDLLAYFNGDSSKATYAIVFKDLKGEEVPLSLKYDIRNYEKHVNWNTDSLFHTFVLQYIPGLGSDKYFQKGFILLQTTIDMVFLKMRRNSEIPVTVNMQEFPYPPHNEDMGMMKLFMQMLPFVTVFSFILVCPATLRKIVEEKDSGIKELMKMMGLPTSIMWFTWFIDAILVNFVSIIFIVVCMKINWGDAVLLEYCDAIIFGMFLFLYCCACIAVCFVISTLLNSPNFTTVIGIIFWNISYLIPYCLGNFMKKLSFGEKMLFCLFPNVALHYGYEAISVYEERGLGVQWSNLFSNTSGGFNDIALGYIFIILFVDVIVFMLLTFYIDSVRPGKYGLGKPWSFPIRALMNSAKKIIVRRDSSTVVPSVQPKNEYIKIEMCESVPGIQIENLYKHYKNNTAVNDLNIDFYKGEITVLLGHNGAGKTTTMSIISGMIKASKGTVHIEGCNINEDLERVRSMIGICPQHNLVFPDLSVYEHLKFFAMLNEIQDADKKINDLLRKLDMIGQEHTIPSKLSGGMKRKLCLGMALILEPKVLILDEPTSGLDPKSRREIWDILLKLRRNELVEQCTVLISTHFMEEAEVLGDRIAVMDHGNLIAYGTSMYLKNEYSTGYILTVIKNSEDVDNLMIKQAVKECIPDAELKVAVHRTTTFLLPNDKEKISRLIKMLENSKSALGIDNIGISITTLEDVFLRISNLVSTPEQKQKNNTVINLDDTTVTRVQTGMKYNWHHGWVLFKNHFMAFKKLWHTYCIYISLCIAIMLLTLILGKPSTDNTSEQSPELNLNLQAYGPSYVYCSADTDNTDTPLMLSHYKDIVTNQGGEVMSVPSVSEALLALGVENIEKYKKHVIVSAEFNKTASDGLIVNAMYSNLALHGAPISLNLIHNVLAKMYLDPDTSIVTRNVPLPTIYSESNEEQSEIQTRILWTLLAPMGMLFLTASFVIHPYKERSSEMKHLLYMAGTKSACYWLQMFIFDAIVFTLMSLVLVFVTWLTFNPIFHNFHELVALFCILLEYGVVVIPCVYLFSYRKSVTSALSLLQILNLFTGVVLTVVVYVLQLSGDAKYEKIGNVLHVLFQVSPQYWLTYTLLQFSGKAAENYSWKIMDPTKRAYKCHFDQNPCCFGNDTVECQQFQSYFGGMLSPTNALFMLMSLVYFTILVFLDSACLKRLGDRFSDLIYGKLIELHGGQDDGLLSVKGLSKKYGKNTVVRNVSFNVKKGTCHGLLGVNGAGKTTTFKMLTGYVLPNSGTANIEYTNHVKYDLLEDTDQYLSRIGYCPQFNAMNKILTGRELLKLFAELRGLTENVDDKVENLVQILGLEEYADVECGKYSGGNKRKLSLGISLVASLNVIMLDEPTSGVDPASRRNLWDVLRKVKANLRQSIILTSHSMDECEALCDELAIIKSGEIKCQDNITNLKMQFGTGFTVLLKVRRHENLNDDYVDSSVPLLQMSEVDLAEKCFIDFFKVLSPTLKDKHLSMLHFYLPNTIMLSKLFENMESFKNKNSIIEDYTINMATLEDVFLSVSKNDETDRTKKDK